MKVKFVITSNKTKKIIEVTLRDTFRLYHLVKVIFVDEMIVKHQNGK